MNTPSPRRGKLRGAPLVATVALIAFGVLAAGCGPSRSGGASGGDTGHVAGDEGATGDTATPRTAPVHAAFALSARDLVALLESDGVDAATIARVSGDPATYLALMHDILSAPADLTWLVDRDHPLPADYEPSDLVPASRVPGLTLNRADMEIRAAIVEPLAEMAAAAAGDGAPLDLSSAYRSYAYQEWLFGYWIEQLGEEQARRVSAPPGASQHQLGTTVDFGSVTQAFAETDAGRWLATHAGRFGFSMSYPPGAEEITGYDWEPWHFRYVGTAATRLESEFFDGSQQRLLEHLHRSRAAYRAAWRLAPEPHGE